VIRDHAFNCAWWGGRVGILEDPAFFDAPDSDISKALSPYEWVELRCRPESISDPWRLASCGFAYADTQLSFRIALKNIDAAAIADLSVRFADQEKFVLRSQDWPDFPHERFRHLPGATPSRVARRYEIWARGLIDRAPEWCVEVGDAGRPQGWFLAEPEREHLNLALAMLTSKPSISGFDLYARALNEFSKRGARLGEARFSIENRAVHNIYARLGAIFREVTGCWLWRAQ
jgi:hypothetical protein